MTNGSDGRDTNSSKAIIARAGIDLPGFVGGISVKNQDGIGSESQKEYNNHVGFDWLFRRGNWGLAGEWIHDEYGLRRPGLGLDQITWGRSLYNRQLNLGVHQPLTGNGYYVNLIYADANRTHSIGYGQFFPDPIGDPIHDSQTYRLQFQSQQNWTPHLAGFVSGFWETPLDQAQGGRPRHGFYIVTGLQYSF